jgi:lipoprotein-anchoring transpeptidase ErfK/SrfK
MADLSRRTFLLGASAAMAAGGLSACTTTAESPPPRSVAQAPRPVPAAAAPTAAHLAMYGPLHGEPFPVPAVNLAQIQPEFLRAEVADPTGEPPGTIVVDPSARYLYHVQGGRWAVRYGVGVGREGFDWSGVATVQEKREWPDWYPPKEMLERRPQLMEMLTELQSGIGMPGGPNNPLGARALYLWQGGRDTLYRIHGTSEPWTIGTNASSGCIRMLNQDAIHLYDRTPAGTRVVVLPARAV